MNWTSGRAIRVTALDSYLMFALNVVVLFHLNADLAASSTDSIVNLEMIGKIDYCVARMTHELIDLLNQKNNETNPLGYN